MIPAIGAVALQAGVYLLVLGAFSAWDVLIGAAVGALGRAAYAPLGARARGAAASPRHAPPGIATRLGALVPFAAWVVRDVTRGVLTVARVVLARHPRPPAAFVAFPIGDRTPAGVALSALTATLSPGSVLVHVDWERRVMLFHVIDARDPDALRAQDAAVYERLQRRLVP
jgi:multisubunit Na+/H+ antiporter MnhE subunit